MPHTRAARLIALKEAAESLKMQQIHNAETNMGWNNYLDWDLPELMYQPDALAWHPGDRLSFFGDFQGPMTDAANGMSDASYEQSSKTEFDGLQPWYSRGMQDSSSVVAVIPPRQESSSECASYQSTLLDEESNLADQTYRSRTFSPSLSLSHQSSSISDGVYSRRPSKLLAIDLTKELDELLSHSSEEEKERISTTKIDTSKKRKIAHSLIEKNYRSRIKDGMAELRYCVPVLAKGKSSVDSNRPGGQPAAEDAMPSHSSGKVATLSDAVQHVKALELQNQTLHGQLDVMQRRNNTLQKIVLSKADASTPAPSISVDEINAEC